MHDATSQHARPTIPPREELATLPPNGGETWNRLVFEQSPYLLQHAANPVDWYPWGEEAFETARRLDKPVFLSVGYATCHWCHVMERESFENEAIGRMLSEAFVCVKVDREERPDVDHVYMTVTQALTGSGGWPMTVLMTPDRKPFFAGTYFAPESRYGRPGMLDLIPEVARLWREERDKLLDSAEEITRHVSQLSVGAPGDALNEASLDLAYRQLASRFDGQHGGFGSAPKFPTPHVLGFLLRYHQRTGEAKALAMVETTLNEMRKGGIFDHVGFGFHRYSTDREWLVPHFEKMLYDQAMLVIACVEAYQATGNTTHADTAREVLTYVLRDMTCDQGGFYSAEDADSEGEEGLFYLWTTGEIRQVLPQDEAELFIKVFQLSDEGNYRDEVAGTQTGRNIPHLARPLAKTADALGLDEAELRRRLQAARETLFAAREKRIHPLKDDKVLTDWNGLMIVALARAGQALGEPAYVEAATRAADFVLSTLRDDNGRLLKRYRMGQAGLAAHLEDYAFMAWGLLELYEASFETGYLEAAMALTATMRKHFWDEDGGGFFHTADDGEALIVRSKDIYDGAIPSGNSVAALVLLKLARITGDASHEALVDAIFRAFSGSVSKQPSAFAQLLQAVDFAMGPSLEVVIAGAPQDEDTRAMLTALRGVYWPNKVVLLRPPGDDAPITRLAPFTARQAPLNGNAAAYVCRNQACNLPTSDPEVMLNQLHTTRNP